MERNETIRKGPIHEISTILFHWCVVGVYERHSFNEKDVRRRSGMPIRYRKDTTTNGWMYAVEYRTPMLLRAMKN